MSVMAIYRQLGTAGWHNARMVRRWIAVFLCLAGFVSWYGTRKLNSQTETEWRWTNKQFGPVLDALMPLQRAGGGVYVTYRANRDYVTSVPEYWFLIGREPNEGGYGLHPYLSAHVRIAQSVSVYDQLMAIHREEPAVEDTTNLQKRVKLQTSDFTEMNCPAIKDQMDKLKRLSAKLPAVDGDFIIIHPMIHAFYIDGSDGDVRMFLADDENPLVKWALETRRALEACSKFR